MIDSGVDNVTDLQGLGTIDSLNSRTVYNQSFLPDEAKKDAGADGYGHGTHAAGIIAGNGAGRDSYVIAALQRAIALKNTYNIRIINLSLGRPVFESYTTDPLCQAVEAAWKAGIVVVVAAGNNGRDNTFGRSGYGTVNSPGNDPYVLTVGAMKEKNTAFRGDDEIASYSAKGPTTIDHIAKPDMVAPGNQIISLLGISKDWISRQYSQNLVPNAYYDPSGKRKPSDTYLWLSGTSMATPMVSGAAALMLQKEPGLKPDQVKARLMKSATNNFPFSSTATDPITNITYTSQYEIFTVGAGYLDIMAALNNKNLSLKTAMSPKVRRDASGKFRLVADASTLWGESALWGETTNRLIESSNILMNGEK